MLSIVVDLLKRHQQWPWKKWCNSIYGHPSYWNTILTTNWTSIITKTWQANVQKKYAIDEMAASTWHVLWLQPYHSVFNLIKMIWSNLKHHAWYLNIDTSQPTEVADLIWNVCDQKITKDNWGNFTGRVMEEKNKFREMDHILDKTEPLVIHLSDSNNSDGSEDKPVWIID